MTPSPWCMVTTRPRSSLTRLFMRWPDAISPQCRNARGRISRSTTADPWPTGAGYIDVDGQCVVDIIVLRSARPRPVVADLGSGQVLHSIVTTYRPVAINGATDIAVASGRGLATGAVQNPRFFSTNRAVMWLSLIHISEPT